MFLLASTFIIVAFLYAMVGFGGGSSYIALLVLFDTPFHIVPIISLTCNIVVVSGGLIHFIKNRLLSLQDLFPFIVTSIPAALIGGAIPIDREVFIFILGCVLAITGIQMLTKPPYLMIHQVRKRLFWLPWIIGGGIGFISGLVGIGGGIFLSPCLLAIGWAKPKNVAALASGFIFVNSVAGLVGQLSKQQDFTAALSYWPCVLAVIVGGQVGSLVTNKKLNQTAVKKLTAGLVLFVAFRIILSN